MGYLGEEIRKLGFGLMRLPQKEGTIDVGQVKEMVDLFMAAGFTYFDTAWAYAGSEEAIRKALVERYPRESYQLATKNAAWINCKTKEEAYAQFEVSLAQTGAGYFDFYLLHNLGESRTHYFDDYDIEKLNELKDSPIFRVSRVRNLLALRHTPIDQFKDIDDADRYYTLAYKFVMLQRGAAKAVIFNKRFAHDKVYLKDMVYVSIYYFTWIRDFVNAEASYGSLDRMGYNDQTSFFYMLLYFLVNFNETRLNNYLKLYNDAYSADYRYDIVTAMMNLYTKNVSTFDSIIRRLLSQDPYLFDKMFIEVNFEKF